MASVKYSNVPESVPGPNSFSGTSGKPERTSFQLSTLEPGSQIFLSSATVRQRAHVFCWFTTTVSASFATVNARHEPMLFVLHDCRLGVPHRPRRIGQVDLALAEALEPAAGARDADGDLHAARARTTNSSAAAVVYGPTVDDPSAVIEPLSFFRL